MNQETIYQQLLDAAMKRVQAQYSDLEPGQARWKNTVRCLKWAGMKSLLAELAVKHHLELTIVGERSSSWIHTTILFQFVGQESHVRECQRELIETVEQYNK